MGRRWERQKALLHKVHDEAGTRTFNSEENFCDEADETCDDSGIIVLFVKQVHLQKEGGATYVSYLSTALSLETYRTL